MTFKTMLGEVLARVPEYSCQQGGAVRYEDIGTINGYKHLPAHFPAGEREGPPLSDVIAQWQHALDSAEPAT
jgi:hypothetical protein